MLGTVSNMLLGLAILASLALCIVGIALVCYRARQPASLSLVSVLVALDPRGESIKLELARLAKHARGKRSSGLKPLSHRACTLLTEYRETFTHAGALDRLALPDSAAFAAASNGVWARDAERAEYPGVPTYTVVALLFAVREAPAPLHAATRADVAQYLSVLAQLSPQHFELMWLPREDRCMTLQELFDRYLAPLAAHAQARSA